MDIKVFTKGETITPHDTNLLAAPYRGLFVSLAASTSTSLVDVAVQFTLGTTITFRVPSGVLLPICPKRVMATGSTASLVVVGVQE